MVSSRRLLQIETLVRELPVPICYALGYGSPSTIYFAIRADHERDWRAHALRGAHHEVQEDRAAYFTGPFLCSFGRHCIPCESGPGLAPLVLRWQWGPPETWLYQSTFCQSGLGGAYIWILVDGLQV